MPSELVISSYMCKSALHCLFSISNKAFIWISHFLSAFSFPVLSWPFLLCWLIHLFATLLSQKNVILWMNIWWMSTLNIQSPCYTALLKLLKCWVTFPWVYPQDQLHWEGSTGQILHFICANIHKSLVFAPSNVLTCLSVDATNSNFHPNDASFFSPTQVVLEGLQL